MNAEQKDVLMRMGAALLFVQTTEQLIRFCMTWVLQKDGPLTLEKLENQTRKEHLKTLGYFLNELRKRADLDENFDVLLEEFLEERNILVHSLDDIPGWSLQTTAGRKIAGAFVDGFIRKTVEVMKVFMGLISSWQEQANIDISVPGANELFAEIDTDYKSLVDELFFEKGS